MIIDCHAHHEPRLLDTERVLAKMGAAGVDRIAMIPAMTDVIGATPERLLKAMRVLMGNALTRPLTELVHRALLTPEGDLRLDGRHIQIYARPDNAGVARLVAAHPSRFLGWIFLNPRNNPTVLDELEEWRHVPGMVGVKVHPHWHDYRTSLLEQLLARCEELGLPLLVHLGFRDRGDFRHMAARHPKLAIICAHAGFPFYRDLWRFAPELPNLYVDLSSPYIDEALARGAVATMGARRCLYGTDSPYGFHDDDGSYDYGQIKGWVERMPASSAEIEGMLGGTFAALIAESAPP